MDAHRVLLYISKMPFISGYAPYYQWILLGSGLTAATIATLSLCCQGDSNGLELRALQNDIYNLASDVTKLKRGVEGLTVNYKQIVDFLQTENE